MKQYLLIFSIGLACVLAFGPVAQATEAPAADKARAQSDKAQAQSDKAQLEAEYQRALTEAKSSRAEAQATAEKAREQMHLAAEHQNDLEHRKELSKAERAELAEMRKELSRVHSQLRASSREISRVNRDLTRVKMANVAPNFVFSATDRPVLGVILGDSNDIGIEVIGVSPDGPAERAGVAAGDVIIALGGLVLAAVSDTDDVREGLNIALSEINADEAVIVSVERGTETLDLSVVPEVRAPLTWQSVVRFPSAPSAPSVAGDTVMIERIVVPQIDTEGLSEQIEQMRVEVETRREMMESGERAEARVMREFVYRSDEMSEMGDFALHDTNVWFGMPLTSGLRLAEIDPALGAYFKTDRGVLVLKAKEDNALLLQSGDVILNVHGSEVDSPAEFMRALRDFEPGDELILDIKRNRKSKTLKSVIEESQARLLVPDDHELHTITITTDSN